MKKENINIVYTFKDISKATEWTIKELVDRQLNFKISSYLEKKVLWQEDAVWMIKINISKNKEKKYLWKFLFIFNWKEFIYENDVPFTFLEDVISHAFSRLKEYLSEQKNKHKKKTIKENNVKTCVPCMY